MFLKSGQFAHVENFLDLPPETKPGGNIEIGINCAIRNDGKAARITMVAKSIDTASEPYTFEVVVVAQVSEIEGQQSLAIKDFINAPPVVSLVFPFLRQAVGDLTLRGRFGPVWLNLINPQLLVSGPGNEAEVAAEPAAKSSTQDPPAKS